MKSFQRILLTSIEIYRRYISPSISPRCRFHPSCSCYAEEAITRYGVFKGTGMAIRRLAKCHPWHPGGMDPVP